MSVPFKNYCNLSPNTLLPPVHSCSLIIIVVVELTEEGGMSNSPLRERQKEELNPFPTRHMDTEIPSASSD